MPWHKRSVAEMASVLLYLLSPQIAFNLAHSEKGFAIHIFFVTSNSSIVPISHLVVAVDKERECQKSGAIKVQDQGGYLASRLAVEMGWGTTDCPWYIHVDAGQTINITLLNFAREAGSDPSNPALLSPDSSICYELGTIFEGKTRKDILTCGTDHRKKNIYISTTNKVHMAFADRDILRSLGYFAIRFEGNFTNYRLIM